MPETDTGMQYEHCATIYPRYYRKGDVLDRTITIDKSTED